MAKAWWSSAAQSGTTSSSVVMPMAAWAARPARAGRRAATRRCRAPGSSVGGVEQSHEQHHVGDRAVVELHRRDVLERVRPERRLAERGRPAAARGGRPSAARCCRTGRRGAPPRRRRGRSAASRARPAAVAVRRRRSSAGCAAGGDPPQALGEPDRPHEGQRRRDEVQRQEILRHLGAGAQPRLDHEPADDALEAAEQEQADEARLQRRRQPPGDPEEGERQRTREPTTRPSSRCAHSQ